MKLGHLLAEVFFGICAVAPAPRKGGTGHILGTLGFRLDRAKIVCSTCFLTNSIQCFIVPGLKELTCRVGIHDSEVDFLVLCKGIGRLLGTPKAHKHKHFMGISPPYWASL